MMDTNLEKLAERVSSREPFSVERLAVFLATVDAISGAGLSPGFGRVTEDEEGFFTISLTIFNSQVERITGEMPELLERARAIRERTLAQPQGGSSKGTNNAE